MIWLTVILTGNYNNTHPYSIFRDITLSFILRNVKAINLLADLTSFKLIIETTRRISVPILGKFAFTYIVFYVYAQFGAILFGGKLTYDEFYDNGPAAFWYLLNFNDFGASLITLFH